MSFPVNLLISGSVLTISGVTPVARMEVLCPLTASQLSVLSISLTSGTVAGDFIVNGAIIANEFKTSIVSASIVYRSGSTKTGDTPDDFHDFTGSVRSLNGFSGSLTQLTDGRSYIAAGGDKVTVLSQSNGQIVVSVTAADVSASYLTFNNTGSLPNERQVTNGVGIAFDDTGPGGTLAIKVNEGVVAMLTGAIFTGPVITQDGLTGSLQKTKFGASYLVAGSGIDIVSQSNGQVFVSALVRESADVSGSYVTLGNTGSLPNERSLVAGPGISIADNGPGATVVISSFVTASWADVSASYVTLGLTGSLPNERVLTAGPGISIVDGGPGAPVTISSVVTASWADVSASYVTLGTTGSLPNERALIAGVGISLFDEGPGEHVVVSASGTPDILSGSGTLAIDTHMALLAATGVGDVVTLPNGTKQGQQKTVIGDSGYGSNTSVITPTNALGFATVTLDATGDTATFMWTGIKWAIVGTNGGSVA